jgi:hypothetical protein
MIAPDNRTIAIGLGERTLEAPPSGTSAATGFAELTRTTGFGQNSGLLER